MLIFLSFLEGGDRGLVDHFILGTFGPFGAHLLGPSGLMGSVGRDLIIFKPSQARCSPQVSHPTCYASARLS